MHAVSATYLTLPEVFVAIFEHDHTERSNRLGGVQSRGPRPIRRVDVYMTVFAATAVYVLSNAGALYRPTLEYAPRSSAEALLP